MKKMIAIAAVLICLLLPRVIYAATVSEPIFAAKAAALVSSRAQSRTAISFFMVFSSLDLSVGIPEKNNNEAPGVLQSHLCSSLRCPNCMLTKSGCQGIIHSKNRSRCFSALLL